MANAIPSPRAEYDGWQGDDWLKRRVAELEQVEAERRLAEAALRDSEARYRTLFDDSPISIWECDWSGVKSMIDALRSAGVDDLAAYFRDHPEAIRAAIAKMVVINVNKATRRIYRVPSRDALFAGMGDFLEQTYWDEFPEMIAALAGESLCHGVECRERAFDGSELHVRVLRRIPEAYRDSWARMIETVEDITERKQAERSLRQEKERAENLLQIAGSAIVALDRRGCVTLINRAGCELLGYRESELIGADWFETVIPADQREDVRSGFDRAINENRSVARCVENDVATKRGDHLRIQWHNTLVRDGDGRVVGTLSSGEDLTDRIEAEKALKESLSYLKHAQQMAGIFYWMWDAETDTSTILFDNEAVLSELASASNGLSDNAYIERFVHPDDRQRVRDTYAEAVRDKADVDMEYRVIPPSGELRIIHEIAQVVLSETGDLVAQVGTLQDVTERRRLEHELRHSQKMEAVGQLTGGVAHDFNNLLAIIMGNLELAQENLDPDSHLAELLEPAYRASRRGAELTERLLAFSRKQTLQPQTIDLGALVSDMADLLRRTLGATIDVRIRNHDELWVCAADPSQMENAILNLAINARDAMPDGGELTIETANRHIASDTIDQHGGVCVGPYVELKVTDTGTGMSPEVRDSAFEPFFTTKGIGEGSGLGLSMVYGFAKQSGGHVAISSEAGRGTEVKLYLPRHEPAQRHLAVNDLSGAPAGRGESILVVEHEPELRGPAANVLRGLGYRVHVAGCGDTALSALKRLSGIDLLLTDVMLPDGIMGPDLVTKARDVQPKIRAVLMDGCSVAERGPRIGSNDGLPTLAKPFRYFDLAVVVRDTLDAP